MKRILLAAALFAVPGLASAQGFYLKGGLGYAFASASQTLDGGGMPYAGSTSQISDSVNTALKYSVKKVAFSSGGQVAVAAGYMFNTNIGVELNATIGVAPTKYESSYNREDRAIGTYTKRNYTQYASRPIMLSPSMVMQVPQKNFTLYARLGAVLPVSNKMIFVMEVEEDYDPNNPATTAKITSEIKTRFGLGFTGAGGVKYKLSDKLYAWGEASLTSLSLYTKEENFTEYIVNGRNVLNLLTDEQKHHEYGMEGEIKDIGSATQSPSFSVPYSNIALNVGIMVDL